MLRLRRTTVDHIHGSSRSSRAQRISVGVGVDIMSAGMPGEFGEFFAGE